MKDEYWGTFSIYDHRSPAYKQSLLFFDRIVVPVPDRPVGRLSEQEIDRLREEVRFLESEGAARLVTWDQEEFEQWRDERNNPGVGAQEGLARRISGDPPYQSRLMLKEQTDRQIEQLRTEVDALSITAIPVYAARDRFEAANKALEGYLPEQLMIDVALRSIPLPREDTPFAEILRIRQRKQFQSSLTSLREWMRDEVTVTRNENPEVTAKRAAIRLEKMAEQYRDALNKARYTKISGTITSVLAIGAVFAAHADPALKVLASVAAPAFSFRTLLRPCWKDLADTKTFAAGVICEAEALAG
jgi:hypothetical protein